METIDLSDSYSFLGNEFLMWLWFKSDCFDGELPIGGTDTIEFLFDEHMRFDAYLAEAERTDLRGGAPAFSPEAKLAVLQGKRLSKAKCQIIKEGSQWAFSLTGDTLDLSAIAIPGVLSQEDAEVFYERMNLVDELEEIMDLLLQEFFQVRLSEHWHNDFLIAFKKWIQSEDRAKPEDYPKALLSFEQGPGRTTFPKKNLGYYIAPSSEDEDNAESGGVVSEEQNEEE